MPFPIDASSAFRFPSELLSLATAVRDAGDYDESRWIEWKSRLPLADHHGQVHLVRQILGFANRDPKTAAQWAEGYGYLLVGVSPGEVRGVTPVDPQVLSQDLTPYLGADVMWSPEYITLDDAAVLIVVIGPPRPGDLIHFLRKDIVNPKDQSVTYREGAIFVRRHGEVHAANHDERLMLQRRLRAGADVLEGLTVSSGPLEVSPLSQLRIREAVTEDRDRLLAAQYDPNDDEASPVRWRTKSDPRTLEEYTQEVDTYLEKMFLAYRNRLETELAEHEAAGLILSICNGTDRSFLGLQLTATLRGASVQIAESKTRASGPMNLPREPEPLGTPQIETSSFFSSSVTFPLLDQSLFVRPAWEAREISDGIFLKFDPVDLRPHTSLELERVPLWIEAAPGTTLTIEWRAASTSAQGDMADTLTVETINSTLEPFASVTEDRV
ncbi:AlbA family DNA-binding domain-containing protein [Spirillospora sp. CA-255316]